MGSKKWWEKVGLSDQASSALEDLKDRCIKRNDDKEKLRWLMTPKGSFSIKEAYNINGCFTRDSIDSIWKGLWEAKLWPKK